MTVRPRAAARQEEATLATMTPTDGRQPVLDNIFAPDIQPLRQEQILA
jgi:hypothetical protein